jgi:hypothetical protein
LLHPPQLRPIGAAFILFAAEGGRPLQGKQNKDLQKDFREQILNSDIKPKEIDTKPENSQWDDPASRIFLPSISGTVCGLMLSNF